MGVCGGGAAALSFDGGCGGGAALWLGATICEGAGRGSSEVGGVAAGATASLALAHGAAIALESDGFAAAGGQSAASAALAAAWMFAHPGKSRAHSDSAARGSGAARLFMIFAGMPRIISSYSEARVVHGGGASLSQVRALRPPRHSVALAGAAVPSVGPPGACGGAAGASSDTTRTSSNTKGPTMVSPPRMPIVSDVLSSGSMPAKMN